MAQRKKGHEVVALEYKTSRVKVKTVDPLADNDRYNILAAIKGHQNYYVNPRSGKIFFKRGQTKISTGCTGIMQARAFVEERMIEISSGKGKESASRARRGVLRPSLRELYKELIDVMSVGKEPSTVEGYWKSWKHGIEFYWGPLNTSDCTDANVDGYKKAYLQRNGTRSFEHTGVHLKMLFRYLLKHGYISKLPDTSTLSNMDEIIRKNKRWVKPGRVYTPKEITAMLEAAEGLARRGKVGGTSAVHKQLLSARAVLQVNLGLVGLRMKEGLALLWENIDLKKRSMQVWSFKNHEWREVPMSPALYEAFKVQATYTKNSKYVFPMPTNMNRHLSNQVFDKLWVQVKEVAQISDWNVENKARFHDLRHTFATMTAELGWPPKVASDVLDMSLQEYDDTYAKPSGSKKSEWMNKTWISDEKLPTTTAKSPSRK